jgi:hypothetical protein
MNRNLTKHFPAKVNVVALNMEVYHPIGRGSLFAKVVFDAPLFFCPGTRGVGKRV